MEKLITDQQNKSEAQVMEAASSLIVAMHQNETK
jgi:hypothetical protein